MGGYLYDIRGTYDIAIWTNIILLTLATLSVLSIKDRRLAETEPVAAD